MSKILVCHKSEVAGKKKVAKNSKEIIVALAGSPNVGKSTLFNTLTGAKQHVANWPGTTVEKKEGFVEYGGFMIRIVDLPGTYGLSAISKEEIIARDFIVKSKPDITVVILDAIALEKSLYLALQVMELTDKVILALNKMDEAENRGIHIHVKSLERKLGVPIVPTVATKGLGVKDLLKRIIEVYEDKIRVKPYKLRYKGLEEFIEALRADIEKTEAYKEYPSKWIALKLLEDDENIVEIAKKHKLIELLHMASKYKNEIKEKTGLESEVLIASIRYDEISHILEGVIRIERVSSKLFTSKLDRVLMHPILGLPALFIILGIVFLIVFSLNTGFPLNIFLSFIGWKEAALIIENYSLSVIFEELFRIMGNIVVGFLDAFGAPLWLQSLVADGIISGVGIVLSFFPLIFLIFVFLGILDDSGYLARAAYVTDRFLRRIGLSGKALVPLLFGLGCNVPAVMATRILEDENERKLATLLAPLIPCQARLVVLLALVTLVIPYDPVGQALTVLGLYTINFISLIVLGIVFSRTIFKGTVPELIIEIPPYHLPSLKVILWHAWDNSIHFLRKAGTIILLLSVVIWFLIVYGPQGYLGPEVFSDPELMKQSWLSIVAHRLAPLAKPLGLDNWIIVSALMIGFVAKEAVLGTIGILAAGSEEFSLQEVASVLNLNPLTALTFLVFVNLYVPCMATIAVIFQETKSLKLAILAIIYELTIAYTIALAIYSIGLLLI